MLITATNTFPNTPTSTVYPAMGYLFIPIKLSCKYVHYVLIDAIKCDNEIILSPQLGEGCMVPPSQSLLTSMVICFEFCHLSSVLLVF